MLGMTRLVASFVLLAVGSGAAGGCDRGTLPHTSSVATQTLRPCPVSAAARRAELPTARLHCLGPGASTLALDHLPARPYIVNFWASWCEPCQREAPRLAAAVAAMGGRVAFLGVDTQDDRDSALKFLQRFGLDYPQLIDPNGDVLYRLPAPGLPVTIAVNASGRLVYRRLGEITSTQLTAALKAIDPHRPVGSALG